MKRILTAWTLVLTLSLTLLSPAIALAPDDISNGSPSGLVAAGDGGYLMTDVFNNVIWKVAADGTVTRCVGQISVSDLGGEPIGTVSDGTAATALFMEPWGIAPFLDGYLVSEPDANVIRYFDSAAVQTAAGTGEEGCKDGAAPTATFFSPTGLAADDQGNVYIADTGNGAIRLITKDGKVSTVFTGLNDPTGLFWKDGALYICETGAHCISKIEDGKRTVLSGAEDAEGYTDG